MLSASRCVARLPARRSAAHGPRSVRPVVSRSQVRPAGAGRAVAPAGGAERPITVQSTFSLLPAQRLVVRAESSSETPSFDSEKVLKDLQAKVSSTPRPQRPAAAPA
jgi:hypothetical protein